MAAPMNKISGLKILNIYRISSKIHPFRHYKSILLSNLYDQDSFLGNYAARRPIKRKILGEKRVGHVSLSPSISTNLTNSAPSDMSELPKVRNRFSKMYENVCFLETIPTESDISCSSHRLLLYNGIIAQAHTATGTYHLLPIGLRALNKLKRLINDEMESIGARELALPCLTPGDLWKTSGRWDTTGSELFKLKDRHNVDHCLGPTHEEVISELVATHTNLSHRQLPLKLYQITRKFRDEMAPKYGLLRGREFEMKDLYTFDANLADAKVTYEEVCGAYDRIFHRLGLKYVKVVGDTGNIGGQLSHEYHLTAHVGQDNLLICKRCDFGANEEMIDKENLEKHKCDKPGCDTDFTLTKGIEVGHAFLLGKKYSKLFKAAFVNEKQKRVTTEMGCYGLGVTRILAAVVEVLSDGNKMRWPKLMAPYQICIVPQKEGFKSDVTNQLAESLYNALTSMPALQREVVLDDRTQLTIGKRVYHANRLGYPFTVAVGKMALENPPKYELMNTYTGETQFLEMNEVLEAMSQLETL